MSSTTPPATSSGKSPATKTLVIIASVVSWLASVCWTEFREWTGRQTTERGALISQFEGQGSEFNALALKFNIKTAHDNRAADAIREAMLANIANQDVSLDRIEPFLSGSERDMAERYRTHLVSFRARLDEVSGIDSMQTYFPMLGSVVEEREAIDRRLQEIKTAYVVPVLGFRMGGIRRPAE